MSSGKKELKKRILTIVLALGMVFAQLMPAYAAPSWPKIDAEIEAEGAILIDADSGAVLYAKNPHEKYYPASITKILTALIVIENVENLDENMVFSHRAVYDVESGSSSAGYDEGDIISVRTALYAMPTTPEKYTRWTRRILRLWCLLRTSAGGRRACRPVCWRRIFRLSRPSGLWIRSGTTTY